MLDQIVPYRSRSSTSRLSNSPLNIACSLDQSSQLHWETALSRSERIYSRGACLAHAGGQPSHLFIVLEGWVQKYRQLSDGRRQITGFCLPNQLCDLNLLCKMTLGHSLAAITAVRVAAIERPELSALMEQCPDLREALVRAELIGANITSEWLVGTGVKSAHERLAHLLCELFIRQNPCLIDDVVDLPMTQAELAEAVGLTQVHANRVLRDLRMRYSVTARNRKLRIPDFAKLAKTAHFRRDYLGFEDS